MQRIISTRAWLLNLLLIVSQVSWSAFIPNGPAADVVILLLGWCVVGVISIVCITNKNRYEFCGFSSGRYDFFQGS